MAPLPQSIKVSKSQTVTTALHCIQLYMLSSFLCCHLKVELLDRSVIHLLFIGLSFLFIETKELCEARAKLEMSSNLADEPTLADVLPPIQNCLMKK